MDAAANDNHARSATVSGRPEVIAYSETGAPIWLLPNGDVVDDLPLPWLDANGNEVFE
jgi:hypothetical protein